MVEYDCGPNFDSLFTAAESRTSSDAYKGDHGYDGTMGKNIDRQNVLYFVMKEICIKNSYFHRWEITITA